MALEPVYVPGSPSVGGGEFLSRSHDSATTRLDGPSGVITFPALQEKRFLERMVVDLSGGVGTVRVYLSNITPSQLVDGVDSVAFAVADMTQPIEWPPNIPLLVAVSNATPGVDFTVTIQATHVQRS